MVNKKEITVPDFYKIYINALQEDTLPEALANNTRRFRKLLKQIPHKKINYAYAEGKWTITCKAWPADAAEPKEAAITHEDATLKGQGKCSIWGTTFSNTPIDFDDVKIEVD